MCRGRFHERDKMTAGRRFKPAVMNTVKKTFLLTQVKDSRESGLEM